MNKSNNKFNELEQDFSQSILSEVYLSDEQLLEQYNKNNNKLESIGEILKQSRIKKNISVDELAKVLKVVSSKIIALENDNFSVFTNKYYARAFILSVCRILEIDSSLIISKFPSIDSNSIETPKSIDAPFEKKRYKLIIFSLLIFTLLIITSYFLLPIFEKNNNLIKQFKTTRSIESLIESKSKNLIEENKIIENINKENEKNNEGLDNNENIINNLKNVPRLLIKANNSTWLQIKNSQDRILKETIMSANEILEFEDLGLLKITVGNAEAVNIKVNGEDFNLASFTRNNVARFNVD